MHLYRQIVVLVAVAFVALPCAASATPSGARTHGDEGRGEAGGAAVVIDWNQTLIAALATAGTPAPVGTRLGAIVQSAVFDAVNGIERRYTAIHVQPAAPRGASREAAVAGAAHEALVSLFPAQRPMLDAQLATSLAGLDEDNSGDDGDDDESVAAGLAWGESVADQIVAWRAGDHFSDALPVYVSGTQPGDWQPTPPGFATQPLFRQLAVTTPFALTSPSQFRPAGPPPLSSARYAADFNEVKAFGNATTPEQAATARFWNGDTPTAIWDRVADQVAQAHDLNLSDDARLLARLNISLADAAIAIWDAKNHFDRWRPVTAIAQADTDGNPDTVAQPGWTPLITTPNFQEYPSGHSGVSSAAATILASEFGDATSFTVSSAGVPGDVRSFTSFSASVAQVNDARVFAGIHFRFACEDANVVGDHVADFVNQTMFLRVHGRDHDD
jgi:PAP2 superfamily